jgi:Ras-related protein Rab-5C
MYYRNANCALVVYDITQTVGLPSSVFYVIISQHQSYQASLDKARTWIRELQRQADPSIIIALCGNKTDLAARRQVTQEEAQKYAEEEGLLWGESSAKSGEGVQEIFMAIGTYLHYIKYAENLN